MSGTTITRYEWFAAPYPDATVGADAAAAGTTQACADGVSFVVWSATHFQVWQGGLGGAWSPVGALPFDPSTGTTAVPIAWANPYQGRIAFLTVQPGGPAFGTQNLGTVMLDGTSSVLWSPDVSKMEFPADHSAAGGYRLWNQGKQALFQFPDRPQYFYLAYQDFTGKSLMVGWFAGNTLEPQEVLSFADSQVSIQLVQAGSQKGNPTLFGEPTPEMGFPPGWMFNHGATIAAPSVGCQAFAALDGWNSPGTFPNVIQFGLPISGTWQVFHLTYNGFLFARDPIVTGLRGYATGQGAGLYPGGRGIIQGPRAWAQFMAGAPLANVQYFPFDPTGQYLGLPLLALPPVGLSANWHPALLSSVPFLLDDAGHWVYLGFASLTFGVLNCVNWLMFEAVKPRGS